MNSAELHAVTARVDVLKDSWSNSWPLCSAERAAGFVAAFGGRLAGRLGAMGIDERIDHAMWSDLAPVFAAPSQRPINTQASGAACTKPVDS